MAESIKLNNGYSLKADIFDGMIRVYVADEFDTVSQILVDVVVDNATDGNEFDIQCWLDPVKSTYTVQHTVELLKSEELDEDAEEIADMHEQATISYGEHGDHIKGIQKRLKELGYFDGTIGGNYLSNTMAAVEAFKLANGLEANGAQLSKADQELLFSDNAVKTNPIEVSQNATGQEYALEMDWWKSDIQKIFAKGTDALITDVETGLQWYEKRRGGTNHADVQPLTKDDTAKLKKAYGGKWSWNRRAIWVTINRKTYAASMNGMPHGGSSIKDNNFDGHHCIHFTNSRTHCSNKVCPNHQKMIKKAASTKLKV